jgi:RND superfamily putative drug exporter
VFARLGRWCYQRRLIVVLLWVATFVIGMVVVGALGTETRSEFELPHLESRRGTDILDANFGGQGGGNSGTIVFEAAQGVDDPEVRSAMEGLFAEVGEITYEGDNLVVLSPYDGPEAERQIASEGDRAGEVAYATVELPADIDQEEIITIVDDIEEVVPEVDGLDVYLGGQMFAEFEAPESEILGLGFAIVILIVSFGSVLAMGLPIGVALAGIGIGTLLGGVLSQLVTMPDFATTLGLMIGLGVGIDYALFIVTRFR